jgi:predicted DsbA family dithiol-disulfide isomerase
MGESSLDSIRQEMGLEVEWRAFELRPAGAPPPDARYIEMVKGSWPRVIAMGQQYGIEMKSHRFGIDTRPAHRAFKIVQGLAPVQAEAFHMALFRAYFEEDQNIGDPAVLVSLANALGLDAGAVAQGLATGAALDEVLRDEQEAHESGITGVPAFIFMDKYLLSGVRPPEEMRAIIEQIRVQEGIE